MNSPYRWNKKPKFNLNVPEAIRENDIRIVTLPVMVIFNWSDEIIDHIDEETNQPVHTSGYVMSVLHGQTFLYNNHPTKFYAQAAGVPKSL